jgi:hypothetical protein
MFYTLQRIRRVDPAARNYIEILFFTLAFMRLGGTGLLGCFINYV